MRGAPFFVGLGDEPHPHRRERDEGGVRGLVAGGGLAVVVGGECWGPSLCSGRRRFLDCGRVGGRWPQPNRRERDEDGAPGLVAGRGLAVVVGGGCRGPSLCSGRRRFLDCGRVGGRRPHPNRRERDEDGAPGLVAGRVWRLWWVGECWGPSLCSGRRGFLDCGRVDGRRPHLGWGGLGWAAESCFAGGLFVQAEVVVW